MRNAILVGALVLAFIGSQAGEAGALGLEVAAGGWQQDPTGFIASENLTVNDRIDLERDARLDQETRAMVRAKIDIPLPLIPNIYLMATPMQFEDTGLKTTNFTFGGVQFNAATPFVTDVTLNTFDIGFYYNLPFMATATVDKLNVELGLNARIVDFDGQVTGRDTITNTTVTSTESFTLPIPMIYLGVQVKPIDLIALEGEVRGISFSGNDYYDLIARLRVNAFGPLFFAGGYRHQQLTLAEEGVNADVEIKGPFLEAGFAF